MYRDEPVHVSCLITWSNSPNAVVTCPTRAMCDDDDDDDFDARMSSVKRVRRREMKDTFVGLDRDLLCFTGLMLFLFCTISVWSFTRADNGGMRPI